MATRPLFEASRMAAQRIMSEPLHYETTDDARIRSTMRQQGVTDEYIDRYLEGWHIVQAVRNNLNL